MSCGFTDQACEIESKRQGITDKHGFRGIAQSKRGGTFELSARLNGIAAFRIGLPANTQFPSFRTNLHVARQTDGTIGQGQSGGQRKPKGVLRIGEGTSLA